jgi:hypothetical protein
MKMRYQAKQIKLFFLFALLLLPMSSFAALNFLGLFTPPSTDISLQVMQSVTGVGLDSLNGKLLRPLLMLMCTGIVVFMGAVFGWNLAKFVLHTAQEGEMMMGKGKQMGLVVLRSVFGMSMVVPIYSGAYKGLCLAFILVIQVITWGIGLADRGVEQIVEYLTRGGTIYQVSQTAQDGGSKQNMAGQVTNILSSQTCVYKLRIIAKDKEKAALAAQAALGKIPGQTPENVTHVNDSDFGIFFDTAKGQASFGTRNKDKPGEYLSECGTASWPIDANQSRAASMSYAVISLLAELDPIAARIAASSISGVPGQKSLKDQVVPLIGNAVFNYSNLLTPLRAQAADQATQAIYNTLQSIKQKGWIVLGAYYPIMGNLNQNNRQSLAAFSPTGAGGALVSGQVQSDARSAYDISSKMSSAEKKNIADYIKYVTASGTDVKAYIAYMDVMNGGTLQEQLKADGDARWAGQQAGPFSGAIGAITNNLNYVTDYFSGDYSNARASGENVKDTWSDRSSDLTAGGAFSVSGSDWLDRAKAAGDIARSAANSAAEYAGYGITTAANFFGLGGESNKTGESLGGLLAHDKLTKSATLIGISAIAGGPVAWVTVPPMLMIFVDVVDKFRNSIDQTANADPLLALQDFGFYTMDKAITLILIVWGGSFVASIVFSWIPSMNPVGAMAASSMMETPLIMMFFAAIALAGVGFGVYIPMIPFIVWISAILGWIGHSFQAIVGAPLVALRMTTAEGEGLLGGAVEGVMMILGVLLTPFLLVIGFSATLILIKQLMIVVNYLFSLFAFYSFGERRNSFAWVVLGVPAILFVYFTLIVGVIQALSTKLIGEFPGEVLRHLHTAMTGHKAAEQMMGKMEQTTEKLGSGAGDYAGKKAYMSGNTKK